MTRLARTVLISIHPRHVEAIVRKHKRIELRRTRPRLVPGDRIFIYASTPTKAVVAVASVKKVLGATPRRLWPLVAAEAGISRQEFVAYMEGAGTAYGIRLSAVRSLPEPVSLDALRKAIPGFCAPQVYRYLSDVEVARAFRLPSRVARKAPVLQAAYRRMRRKAGAGRATTAERDIR